MFKNYLSTALHNLVRNKLYAGINIVGLAVGFAAAIFIGLFVRDEYSYDGFIPEKDRIFLVPLILRGVQGQKEIRDFAVFTHLASLLKTDFPDIAAIGRLFPGNGSFRSGEVETNENFFWVDPQALTVLKLPTVAGKATAEALKQPNSVVITRKTARKYFGKDDVVGETLQLNREHPLRVNAVLEDYPSNTHLNADIMVAGGASFSRLKAWDDGKPDGSADDVAYTYLKLKAGANVESLRKAKSAFIAKHFPPPPGLTDSFADFDFVSIEDVHLYPAYDGMQKLKRSIGGSKAIIYAMSMIGALIVLVAGINFVTLMTARASRRAVEVGVRKAAGAAQSDLIMQFLGESLIYALLSMVLAMTLVELLLPAFNALLDREILFDYWRDLRLSGSMLALTFIVGALAGLYPAFVLAAFRPLVALKSGGATGPGSGRVRYALVIAQFAILILLILATGIIQRQTLFAMNEGMRLTKDQTLWVKTTCESSFKDEIKRLPGVLGAACANGKAMHHGWNGNVYARDNGKKQFINQASVDFGFFELYGLKPIAGRFFSEDRGMDAASSNGRQTLQSIVLNESAVRELGFHSASEALGQVLQQEYAKKTFQIVGVAPDYSLDPLHEPARPIVFDIEPGKYEWLNIKLSGRQIPDTLAAIDGLWKQAGDPKPIERLFFDQHLQALAADVARQAHILSIFSAIAVFIACLGLFGLSAFTAERRTKEIGIRKAMGASRGDILKLLVWQFTRPVLWANLLAWPVGYFAMNHWLQGFPSHVDLPLWIFLAASSVALFIALATVSGHAYVVAGAKPVGALRYE